MESKPSRYHHRKLSSFSNGFSSKNAYDDVFSGPPSFGAREVSSRVVEDYKAIFGSSRSSSIPILDLSPPGTGDGSSDYRSSELDYSNIFGGLREEDAGVSYEQVVANGGTRREKSSSPKVRIPSAAGSPLHSAETLKTSSENKVFPSDASFQSFDDKKHFNMSYNVSNTGSKDSRNGTTYITQFHPVPGFTCFIDETTPRKIEADKPKSSVISEIWRKLDLSEASLKEEKTRKAMSHLSNKETFGREVKSGNGFSWDGSSANDKLFNKHENNHKSHSSEMRPPSSVPAKIDHDENLKRSGASYSKASNKHASEHAAGDCSPTLYGEELDVNSAAAASAAVLKDAIQKAQESIRIAKELMERKKEGLRSRSSHGTRNSLKVRDRRETIIAHEENRTDDTNTKETSGDVDYVSQLFSGMRRKSGLRSGPRAPIKPISPGNNRTVVPFIETMAKDEPNVMEVHIFLKTLEPQEVIVQKESADEKSHELAYRVGKLNNAKAEKESENRVDQVESANLVCEHQGIVNCSNSQEDEVTKETHTDIYIKEDGEKKLKDSQQNDNDAFGVDGFKENHNDKRLDYVQEQEEIENKQEVSQQDNIIKAIRDLEEEGSRYTPEKICRKVVDDERFEDTFQWTEDENEPKEGMGSECNNKEKDIYMRPDSEWRDKVDEQEIRDKTMKDIPDEKESKQLFEDFDLEGYEQDLTKISAETEHMHIEAEKREVLQEATYEIDYKATVWSPDVRDKNRTKKAFQNEINHINSETCQEVDDSTGKIEISKDFYNFKVGEAEAVKLAYRMREKEHGKIVTFAQNHAEDTLTGNGIKVLFEAFPSEDSPPKFGSTGIKLDKSEFAQRNSDLYSDSNLELGPDMLANESTEKEDAREDNNSNHKEGEKSSTESFDEKERHVERDFGISEGFGVSKAKQKTIEIDDEIKTRQNTKKNESSHKTIVMEEKEMEIDEVIQTRQSKYVNDENHNKVLVMEEKETKNTVSEVVKEEECLSKIYEENKREREREKEKIAVERAIREARERAFAEAREKAERAAVERATAEVRHRVMAEVREKFDKDTAATKVSTEKASFKAKLRSERAAVERATAEARERALEKALSQKARAQAERSTSQNMSGPSGDNSMKKSFSSSDLEKNYETNTDLVQRNKANLEKHERIMERAAKALAEKNMRDLLAQKEQAEKNRLAEALDADIKRWSSGKEGNLRALLSTLQYILGPGNGWQPISLTEIITTSAVKKAYRKATLYVHPDKLQQRGASIQQKYICEKVFDLLKAAWTRFDKEEK